MHPREELFPAFAAQAGEVPHVTVVAQAVQHLGKAILVRVVLDELLAGVQLLHHAHSFLGIVDGRRLVVLPVMQNRLF